jgi:hypothetical protein
MRRLPVGLRDVRVALGVIVGMLLAGFLIPLASSEPKTRTGVAAGQGATNSARASIGSSGATASGTSGGGASGGGVSGGGGPSGGAAGVGGGGTTGGAGAPGVPLTASDQGVTPDSIKLGVALADLDALSNTGVAATNGTVAQRTAVWHALIDDANSNGGAAGRKIDGDIQSFNPIDTNAGPDLCRRFTEDDKIFMAIGDVGVSTVMALCFTQVHKVPIIVYDPQDMTTYADAGGLMVTTMPNNDRIQYATVKTLHERGLLQGHKLGLVTATGISTAFDRTMVPTLESLGYKLTDRADIDGANPANAASQIPVAVNDFAAKGVDFVMWEGGPVNSNLWINQAQKRAYNPKYSFDEFSSGSDDFAVQTVSGPIDGVAFSARRRIERRDNSPTAPSDAACIEKASKSGVALVQDRSSDLYWDTEQYCSQLSAFVDAATRAGPNPDRPGFAAAVANLGQRPDLEVGPPGVGGSWSPYKLDAADYLHDLTFNVSCKNGKACWVPSGDWFPMRVLGG